MNERGLVDLRELERLHPSSTFTRGDGKVKKRLKDEERCKETFWLSSMAGRRTMQRPSRG